MNHLFPPILDKNALQPPVLAIAAHPDDEVIAVGGMLLWHRQQGHPVTVLHITDGAAGDPDSKFGEIQAVRQREGREALARLQVEDVRSKDLPDGELPERIDQVTELLRETFRAVRPKTLYSFFFTEAHRDHRAVGRALATAADALDPDCRVLLFGVNQVVCGGSMLDITGLEEQKQHALAAFESQLAYNDFRRKILHRDNAATVNVEDPNVQYAELVADLRRDELPEVLAKAEALYTHLLRDEA